MPTCQQTLHRRAIPFAILPAVFFALFYGYVWLRVDPRLVYHQQCPIFMVDSAFLKGFLHHPGGLVEYLCALLSQFYPHPWAGALVITLAAALVCLASGTFLRQMGGVRVRVIHLVPAIPLLMLHNQYDHPLTTSVGLLIALLFLNLYVCLFLRSVILRLAIFLPLSVLVYYVTAGPYLLFVVLCSLFEFLTKRHRVLAAFYLLSALAVPYVAARYIFEVGIIDPYTHLLPFHRDIDPSATSVALYALFPLVAIAVSLRRRPDRVAPTGPDTTTSPVAASPLEHGHRAQLKWICQSVALLAVAAGLAFLSFDSESKTVLQVDYYARHEMWPEVLQEARRLGAPRYRLTTRWDVNRALFHTGRLPYDMFSYPQDPAGLLSGNFETVTQKLSRPAWANLGEIYLELGRVAEAQFRTHEALEHLDERPEIVERLLLIYLVKQQSDPARIALNALSRHLLWKNLARDYRRRIEQDPFLSQDEEVQHIRCVMIEEDRLGHVTIETMLQQLLERNKRNRMAFEYLMAYYLLTRQVGKVTLNIGRLDDFSYPGIPRYYEEAILLDTRATDDQDVSLHGRQISPDTRQRFEAFFKLHDRCGGNKEAAREVLMADYGESYFFYYMFGVTGYDRAFAHSSPAAGARQ